MTRGFAHNNSQEITQMFMHIQKSAFLGNYFIKLNLLTTIHVMPLEKFLV
jgi:hypothetical protein